MQITNVLPILNQNFNGTINNNKKSNRTVLSFDENSLSKVVIGKSYIEKNSDSGVNFYTKDDKLLAKWYPNGTREQYRADGTILLRILPDDSVIVYNKDGSMKQVIKQTKCGVAS